MDINDMIELRLVMEIHTSGRRSFRSCRRRWDWIFNERWYPFMTAKPLEFGVAYHKAMEVYYAPETWNQPRVVVAEEAIQVFISKCEQQKADALKYSNRLYFDDDVDTDYAERVELGRGMLNYYFTQVAPILDQHWYPIRVEIGFFTPIPNPHTGETIYCKCAECWEKWTNYVDTVELNSGYVPLAVQETELEQWEGLPVVYAGRLDMLAKDAREGYWIFDWKTARAISKDDEFLYLDDQVGSYVWALWKLGIPLEGFVYHEQRKGYPQPPKMNKVRRLGCIFSVAKNQDVDYDTYLETVKNEDTSAYEEGYYDEMLEYLKNEGTAYFARHQIHKSHDELREIERNIGLEALEMVNPDLAIYPSPGRFGCNFCAFRQPCLEANARRDPLEVLSTLFERRDHYYIRAEASTESKGAE